MSQVIEGIILRKNPVGDRDSIAQVLTRSGSRFMVYIFGAQGSKSNKTAGKIEVGFNVSFSVDSGGKKSQNLPKAKEVILRWSHENIRTQLNAFYLLSFFCEVISLVTFDQDNDHDQSLFVLLSNAIFQLDQNSKDLNKFQHLFIFLAKLIHHQGLSPDFEYCTLCHTRFGKDQIAHLDFGRGGFICSSCASNDAIMDQLISFWSQALMIKYANLKELPSIDQWQVEKILSYFLFQIQTEKNQLKTLNFIL